MDDEEWQKCRRFKFERDRRRYRGAHTAVRTVLGGYLQRHPCDLRFESGPHGKPRLADATHDLRFNLSHSHERALLAVTLGREVGVDIEHMRPVPDMFGVARHVFSPREMTCLRAASSEQQHDMFFRIWTRKESFIKATGDGMHYPLKSLDVSTEPSAPQLLLACAAGPDEVGRWTMRTLSSEPDYSAAITVEGAGFNVEPALY